MLYAMFITNSHASFDLWWNENSRKYQRVSKYYVHDCSCIEYFTEMVGSVLHNKTLHTTFYKDIKGVQPNPLTPGVHKKDIFSTRWRIKS